MTEWQGEAYIPLSLATRGLAEIAKEMQERLTEERDGGADDE